MSISSRARRVQRSLPWRSYQTLLQQLQGIRPTDEQAFIEATLRVDVPQMSFETVVNWTRWFGRVCEDEHRERGLREVSLAEAKRVPALIATATLTAFLSALDTATLQKLLALYYLGRGDGADLAALQAIVPDVREHVISNLVGKLPLDEYLGVGLERFHAPSIDHSVSSRRHEPRDFVKQPVDWMPIRVAGHASFMELLEVLSAGRDVPLVGEADPHFGPYSSCIVVPNEEVDRWCSRGYRKLTSDEERETIGDVEDFTAGWKHSD